MEFLIDCAETDTDSEHCWQLYEECLGSGDSTGMDDSETESLEADCGEDYLQCLDDGIDPMICLGLFIECEE